MTGRTDGRNGGVPRRSGPTYLPAYRARCHRCLPAYVRIRTPTVSIVGGVNTQIYTHIRTYVNTHKLNTHTHTPCCACASRAFRVPLYIMYHSSLHWAWAHILGRTAPNNYTKPQHSIRTPQHSIRTCTHHVISNPPTGI